MRPGKMRCSRLALRAMLAVLGAGILMLPESAAEGNLTRRAVRLEALKIDAAKGFSKKSYQLETGKYYRWRVISDGRDEYSFRFPELSRNAWFDVFFVPIRPGTYEFFVENYRKSGMLGVIEVR